MDFDRAKERLIARSVLAESGCIEWRGATANGYGRLKFGGQMWLAHRLAYAVEAGEIPPRNLDVCHKCDNRLCVNRDHLFLGTRKENMQDCAAKKRLAAQNNKPKRVLNETHIDCVRELLASHSQREVAKMLGVCKATIWLFKKRYFAKA